LSKQRSVSADAIEGVAFGMSDTTMVLVNTDKNNYRDSTIGEKP
jgi:hypothetical protein